VVIDSSGALTMQLLLYFVASLARRKPAIREAEA
jgi:hypothetical protein